MEKNIKGFQKRHTPWNKGKKCPKISKGLKKGYKKGRDVWNKGLTKKMDKRLSQPWLGKKNPDHSKRMKGENNPAKRLEVRKKISRGVRKVREQTVKKMVATRRKNDSYIFSKEQKEKMRKSHLERIKRLGYTHTPEAIRKQRISLIKHIKEFRGNVRPNIGKHEKQLLDEFELSNNLKLIRQFYIKDLGYFIDGYYKELNLVVEIDEKPKIKERDIKREKEIKEELDCEFIRIKDY